VKIDLIVRGICCLRPGLKGISDNITVRSIVDRFLEHSRVFHFENACQPEAYICSADWMPRNFFSRIELMIPIHDGVLRERVREELLQLPLNDNVKSRMMRSDGQYRRLTPKPDEPLRRSQAEFMRLAQERSHAATAQQGPKSRYPRVKLASRPSGKKE
jgi:polyphosphate kinase